MSEELIERFNVPGPRYTSYPTVPYWEGESFSTAGWAASLIKNREAINGALSLYIHLPFCESMCTFCGCNKRITKNHGVESPYIEALLKEFRLYLGVMGNRPLIREIHLGGGTPTFFSPENLRKLLSGIFSLAEIDGAADFSFEGHPNNTTAEHLHTLAEFGFSRVCYGVQDYNPAVQRAINRIQPFEKVAEATANAREAGYNSVGHDIIYGLPFQGLEDIRNTIEKTISLLPDRIAFYSYAHVPWIKGNGQRGFKDGDLPSATLKQKQQELGRELLLQAGYVQVGMDHFALPSDGLSKAREDGRLHRNFMGYTVTDTQLLIGLGVSAISDSWFGFAQNEKRLEAYYARLEKNEIPVFRGHLLTGEDLVIRRHILNLMCRFRTSWERPELRFPDLEHTLSQLREFEAYSLVKIGTDTLEVTPSGQDYLRNICMCFDLRLQRKQPESRLFSMTV